MSILKKLKGSASILFFSPSDERPQYDLYKTVAELARLTNEITGYLAELEYDFDRQAIASHFESEEYRRNYGRTFHYIQMNPQNQFVTDIVKRKTQFMERYMRCRALFNDNALDAYRREQDPTITDGQHLLGEIQRTGDKLPLSMGLVEFEAHTSTKLAMYQTER